MSSEVHEIAALLIEAADSVHASLAEADISPARREYRVGLEARLRAAAEPEAEIEAAPVGSCPKCGIIWYTRDGFCGGCGR